jgi:hypothetical protein
VCSFSICCLLFRFLCVCVGGGFNLPRGLCYFVLRVVGGIPHDAWRSPVWSTECLRGRFGAGGGPPVFSV